MRHILLTLLVLVSVNALATSKVTNEDECSKYCDPGKSKPSGKGCINKHDHARKKFTTACIGFRDDWENAVKPDNWVHPDKYTETRSHK